MLDKETFLFCCYPFSLFFCALLLSPFTHCGMNDQIPALLSPLAYPAATRPEIRAVNLRFLPEEEARYQFDIQYFITNTEPDFAGYNLYVSNLPSSLEGLLGGKKENRYLENRRSPSFSHSDSIASSGSQNLITQRVIYRRAPPSPEPFYQCYVYYFRLTAYLRGGFESEASTEEQVCASNSPVSCPVQTPCNP